MFECTCGLTFPGTLSGAWEAKQHAEAPGHHLLAVAATKRAGPARRAA